jgi:cytochrome d ubiquinol oxidase subunit II
MSAAVAVAVAMFAGLGVYALFGGADFGAGFFDLTAGRRRGDELRSQIDHSIGPVWEANHVWLIYVLVIAWTGFPTAFAAVTTTLMLPLALALLGIVARGASFAFRKYAPSYGHAQLFGVVFSGSSLIAPFFLGTVAGAIASGAGAGPRGPHRFVGEPDVVVRRRDRRRVVRVPGRGVPDRRRGA